MKNILIAAMLSSASIGAWARTTSMPCGEVRPDRVVAGGTAPTRAQVRSDPLAAIGRGEVVTHGEATQSRVRSMSIAGA